MNQGRAPHFGIAGGEGMRQIMLYPPLNRNDRVIEDFAAKVMTRM